MRLIKPVKAILSYNIPMDFQDIIKRARDIKESYQVLNRTEGYRTWGVNEYAEGFVGDVGDLMKLVMAKKGLRFVDEDVDAKLKHELADCLWSIIVIADELDIDLEQEFVNTMNTLEGKISGRKVITAKKARRI